MSTKDSSTGEVGKWIKILADFASKVPNNCLDCPLGVICDGTSTNGFWSKVKEEMEKLRQDAESNQQQGMTKLVDDLKKGMRQMLLQMALQLD